MKIGFLDPIDWDYNVETVYAKPLGGSQSALCYLSEALAKQGHEVCLFNNTLVPGNFRGVDCLQLPLERYKDRLRSLDAFIILNRPVGEQRLKDMLGPQTRLILWTQHEHNAEPIQILYDPATERNIYDAIVLVSDWHRQTYHEELGFTPDRTWVMRNAIAPHFCNLFPDNVPIRSRKSQPPILAYTSTPFRGLDLLIQAFPKIRNAVPGIKLKVFSSLKVYQFFAGEDDSRFGSLYRQCKDTEGIEYIGSVSQPELARQMRDVSILAYPNTLPETSCIAIMEAMASGCSIVTSDLAALPETTAGFARLIPVEGIHNFANFSNWSFASHPEWQPYIQQFVSETIQAIKQWMSDDNRELEAHLRAQVDYVNHSCTWSVRAEEWVQWLNTLAVKK